MQGELEAGLQQTSFQQCVQSEQAVRDEIKKEWSTFTTPDKTHCVAWRRQEENRATPSSSPVWKWRAMCESYTKINEKDLIPRPHPSQWGYRRGGSSPADYTLS